MKGTKGTKPINYAHMLINLPYCQNVTLIILHLQIAIPKKTIQDTLQCFYTSSSYTLNIHLDILCRQWSDELD